MSSENSFEIFCGELKGYTGPGGDVVIPDGVKNIGQHAFNCFGKRVTNVIIPDCVREIDCSAFSGCSGLKKITIGKGVWRIRENAFHGCAALSSITIPDNVKEIEGRAFFRCTALGNIVLGGGVRLIGRDAFTDSGYYNDESNWEDGVLYIGNWLIRAKNDISGDYIIKDGITHIAQNAFSGCANLKSVTLPSSMEIIDFKAFAGCKGLTSVSIPDTVTEIAKSAFYVCNALENVVIPDSVTTIGDYAFCNCTALKTVIIPESVTFIGNRTFSYMEEDKYYPLNVSFRVSEGSYAHKYAQKKGIPFGIIRR